jgi:thiol-disulfide isomerase/thioredoxin
MHAYSAALVRLLMHADFCTMKTLPPLEPLSSRSPQSEKANTDSQKSSETVKSLWFYAAIVMLLVASAFLAFYVLPSLTDSTHPMVGKTMPHARLEVLSGTPAPASSTSTIVTDSLKGRVIVLDFWAPWCNPCRASMPAINRVAKKLASENVMIIGVLADLDYHGAREFLKEQKIEYPQVTDDDNHFSQALFVKSLPTLVVFDSAGIIRGYHVGTMSEDELEKLVRKAMK